MLRIAATNAFIAVILAAVLIDTLPQSPAALHRAIEPTLVRLGINQGAWALFAPDPDRANARLKADITYRDGETRAWQGPDWSQLSAWDKWVQHRHFEWFDHIINQKGALIFEPWCRRIARDVRPDLPDADRGAEVRLVCAEAVIPPAERRPWTSFRQPATFDESWVVTIEKLE